MTFDYDVARLPVLFSEGVEEEPLRSLRGRRARLASVGRAGLLARLVQRLTLVPTAQLITVQSRARAE